MKTYAAENVKGLQYSVLRGIYLRTGIIKISNHSICLNTIHQVARGIVLSAAITMDKVDIEAETITSKGTVLTAAMPLNPR